MISFTIISLLSRRLQCQTSTLFLVAWRRLSCTSRKDTRTSLCSLLKTVSYTELFDANHSCPYHACSSRMKASTLISFRSIDMQPPPMSSGYPQGSDHNTSVTDLLNDKDRVEYLRSYLSSLHKAMRYSIDTFTSLPTICACFIEMMKKMMMVV